MLPLPELSAHVDQLIRTCELSLEQPKSKSLDQPLPRDWLGLQAGERHPLWIAIARQLFSGHWSKAQQRAVLRCAKEISQGQRPGGYFGVDLPGGMAPERVLLLAAYANGWDDTALLLEPIGLQDRLMCAALHYSADTNKLHEPFDSYGPQPLETLDLTQMLVYGKGPKLRSRLLALRLRTFDSSPDVSDDLSHSDARRLIPDVGACLLGLDENFRRGLDELQTLLDAVVKSEDQGTPPPAIAWSLHLLPLPGDSVQHVDLLQGASATAALAYGALYLLRHHLNTALPNVAPLIEDLLSIDDPASVTITAQFKPCDNPAQRWAQHWPELGIIVGASDKLKGLDSQLPTGRHAPHRFVAQGQSDHDGVDLTTFGAREASDLGDLLHQIAQQTSQLDADERRLQAALLSMDAQQVPTDPPTVQAMERLASRGALGAGVRKHLLWRYAQLCSGQPRPFGNVAQIGQHFVSLTVEGPRGHGTDPYDPNDLLNEAPCKEPQSLKRPDLRSIFYPEDQQDQKRWQSVPAWVILAPPFSGKTTLLNVWELSCIRAALKRQRDTGQWGEVPVFLPMNAFARLTSSTEAANPPSAEQLGQALAVYARLEAPALPWSELLPEQLPSQQQLHTPRRDGLRLRLCIDALNEYRTGQANESDAITRLCEWLAMRCDAQAPGALLPPVFSVRREEKGNFALKALKGHWVAHEISVQPWGASQMRAYVRQRRLPADTEAKLLTALGLPGAEATDEELISADQKGPANPLASLCTVPGFLSAQCTLLAHWPHLQPCERRAEVMLALAWYSLDRWRGSADFEALKNRAFSDPAMAKLRDWLLPRSAQDALEAIQDPTTSNPAMRWAPGQAGGLIEGLTQVALALQEARGGAREAAPWRDASAPSFLAHAVEQLLHPPLQAADPSAHADEWLEQAKASGLAIVKRQRDEDGWPQAWLSFSHHQIQEFFSALSVTPSNLPDLTPDPFEVATEDLDDYLRQEGSKLELPAVTPHTERLRYAADLATKADTAKLIAAVLQQGNLALAAQLAIDQRARLEPPADASGRVVSHGFWFPERRHPLLQHIRARLLLASVDTGAATQPKLHASGVLAGVADTVLGLPEPWLSQWAPLLPALLDPEAAPPQQDPAPGWPAPLTTGVDLRRRLHYGLLLGELGDNIRYERCSAEVPVKGLPDCTEARIGIRLKTIHWVNIPGAGVQHKIGDTRWSFSQPPRSCLLPQMRFSCFPAVEMEYQAFIEDCTLLKEPNHQTDNNSRQGVNPLIPATNINWHKAQEFTHWTQPFLEKASIAIDTNAHLQIPTEVQFEAAIRFLRYEQHQVPASQKISNNNPTPTGQPSEAQFNHYHMRLKCAAPIGVFSSAWTQLGIEVFGNVWTWCANAATDDYSFGHNNDKLFIAGTPAIPDSHELKDREPTIARRGGSYVDLPECAHPSFRGKGNPNTQSSNIGLRWVLSAPCQLARHFVD